MGEIKEKKQGKKLRQTSGFFALFSYFFNNRQKLYYFVMNLTNCKDNSAVTGIHGCNSGCIRDHDVPVIAAFFQLCLHLQRTLWTVHVGDHRTLFFRLSGTFCSKLTHTGKAFCNATRLIQFNNKAMVCPHDRFDI